MDKTNTTQQKTTDAKPAMPKKTCAFVKKNTAGAEQEFEQNTVACSPEFAAGCMDPSADE